MTKPESAEQRLERAKKLLQEIRTTVSGEPAHELAIGEAVELLLDSWVRMESWAKSNMSKSERR